MSSFEQDQAELDSSSTRWERQYGTLHHFSGCSNHGWPSEAICDRCVPCFRPRESSRWRKAMHVPSRGTQVEECNNTPRLSHDGSWLVLCVECAFWTRCRLLASRSRDHWHQAVFSFERPCGVLDVFQVIFLGRQPEKLMGDEVGAWGPARMSLVFPLSGLATSRRDISPWLNRPLACAGLGLNSRRKWRIEANFRRFPKGGGLLNLTSLKRRHTLWAV